MTIRAVLFDLDGTLLNTNELILQTFEYTLDSLLHRQIPRPELVKTFGRPLREVMADFDPQRADELLAHYRAYNAQIHDDLVTVFPDVPQTLAQLRQLHCRMAVVTSKKRDMAMHGLSLFDLTGYFDAIITPEDTLVHKPEPEPVLAALAQLNITPQEAVMVGDSPYDLLSGQRAGTRTAAVKYSVHSPEILAACRPDYTLDTVAQLLQLPDLMR